ncbi:SPOR domain-containing protein [Ramlibacter ginsenosidimutans]|uniref:SPOR domain-containing protein n=1 Tax=Ramlibacter ginsenosidimutans TaxID=502333 RepID=A0A934TQK1_9BURK|nr:SPOR domain-containing protein [Ramlibacter ginsenosidimutans]MBK6005741.1 SPOR domain-containing protein [Ramlibacter ginsenosidimutans]
MLRLLVLLLLLANAGYYAWSHGLLLAWGAGPSQQSEPQRVQQQVRPEAVQVLSPSELKQVETVAAQAPRQPECLQTAALDPAQLTLLRGVLASWPAGSWSFAPVTEPARWIVYMGKYPGVEQLAHKRAELRQLGITFDAPGNPELEPGLSLGAFPTEAAATAQLATLAERGVRTARVVQDRSEQKGEGLQLPAVDDSLRPRLEELKPALANKPLRPCR